MKYNGSNLIPFDAMPAEHHREISARGGRASGEAKRRRIELRAELLGIMEREAAAEDMADEVMEAVQMIRRRERKRQRDRERKQRERSARQPR